MLVRPVRCGRAMQPFNGLFCGLTGFEVGKLLQGASRLAPAGALGRSPCSSARRILPDARQASLEHQSAWFNISDAVRGSSHGILVFCGLCCDMNRERTRQCRDLRAHEITRHAFERGDEVHLTALLQARADTMACARQH